MQQAEIDIAIEKHDLFVMKKITISLEDDVANRASAEAAEREQSLSQFLADLVADRCKAERRDKRALLRTFFDGPGYPGISKAWPGRAALYAEREDELARRYGSSHSQVK
jgi:hypothetical protein